MKSPIRQLILTHPSSMYSIPLDIQSSFHSCQLLPQLLAGLALHINDPLHSLGQLQHGHLHASDQKVDATPLCSESDTLPMNDSPCGE